MQKGGGPPTRASHETELIKSSPLPLLTDYEEREKLSQDGGCWYMFKGSICGHIPIWARPEGLWMVVWKEEGEEAGKGGTGRHMHADLWLPFLPPSNEYKWGGEAFGLPLKKLRMQLSLKWKERTVSKMAFSFGKINLLFELSPALSPISWSFFWIDKSYPLRELNM